MALPQPLVLDVDTGLDDALALLLALRSPEVNVVGVTTVAGNVALPDVLRNTRHVLDTAGATSVPVAAGAAAPLVCPLTTATFFHGPHGLGDVVAPEPTSAPVAEPAPSCCAASRQNTKGSSPSLRRGRGRTLRWPATWTPAFPATCGSWS